MAVKQIVVRAASPSGDGKDNYLLSRFPSYKFGTDPDLAVGYEALAQSRIFRSLLEFYIPPAVLATNLVSAKLQFTVQPGYASPEPDIDANFRRCTRPEWEELGSNWNQWGFSVGPDKDWTTPGGDFDNFMAGIPWVLPTSSGLFEITHSRVQEYSEDAILNQNRRLILLGKRATEAGTEATCWFYSADHPTVSEQPALVLEYEPRVQSGRPPLRRASYQNRLGRRPGSWRPSWLGVG